MPLPIILGAAAAGSALYGAKKGRDAYKNTKKAKSLNEKAERKIEKASAALDGTRKAVNSALEELGEDKLECWDEEVGRFVELFEQLQDVELTGAAQVEELNAEFTENSLSEMRKVSLEATDLVTGAAGSVGSGTLTALAAYGLAANFGTATTGTAIGSLSGAAASNATLAWFGGGAVASSGLGIAGGTVVLGGLVAGPALAVGGMIANAKVKKKVAEAKKNVGKAERAAAKMRTAQSGLSGIQRAANLVSDTLETARAKFSEKLDRLNQVIEENGTDYESFEKEDRQLVHKTVTLAQVVKALLETPLLTEDGGLSGEHTEAVEMAEEAVGEV